MKHLIFLYSFISLIIVFLVRVPIRGGSIWIDANKLHLWLKYLMT